MKDFHDSSVNSKEAQLSPMIVNVKAICILITDSLIERTNTALAVALLYVMPGCRASVV